MKIGVDRLQSDFLELGYDDVQQARDANGVCYAIIPDFEIPVGSFAGRRISLAIPAPANYPQGIGASVHIKAEPILVEKGQVQDVRNVCDSALGGDWQYWSYRFVLVQANPAAELMSQIHGIFKRN